MSVEAETKGFSKKGRRGENGELLETELSTPFEPFGAGDLPEVVAGRLSGIVIGASEFFQTQDNCL